MKTFSSIFLLLISVFSFTINAQLLQKSENLLANKNNSQWSFEENHGQLADENGVVISDIKYYGKDKGVAIYLRKNKISFVFSKTETKSKQQQFSEATGTPALAFPPPNHKDFSEPEELTISTSRIDLELAGANKNAQLIAEEKISYYTNYYLAHTPEEGITHVPHYKNITYKNIYNNIDLVLHVKDQGLKYDFVVHPKGKVSDIKLLWNGTKPDVLADGGIKYASTLGEITESRPFSYVSENGKEVESRFKVKGNVVGFEVGNYDESKMLVIDPMLVWGTYYGGKDWDEGKGICTDDSGNVFVVGYTNSTSSIATAGTYSSIPDGGWNTFIIKFSGKGERQWGTYYGGNEADQAYDIAADENGDVYITGMTYSLNGIATTSAYQTTYGGGGYDAFIAKFNSKGLRNWGTYFGGENHDHGLGISSDGKNIYITGETRSLSKIATVNAHKNTYSGGYNDAFIAKFDSLGTRQWSTYFGGPDAEKSNCITVDKTGNIYIAGETNSASGIVTQGSHQTTFGGGAGDAFLARFSTNGVWQWGSYYGGLELDKAFGITAAADGNVFITGETSSESGIATAGIYQPAYVGGFSDGFIVKFNAQGARQWGTYYGGEKHDKVCGISTGDNGDIYVIGGTGSSSGIATKGSYRDSFPGSFINYYSVFVVKLNAQCKREWASYFNAGMEANGRNLTLDNQSNIYFTGTTNQYIALENSHQDNFGGGVADAFIVKFGFIGDGGAIWIDSALGKTCSGVLEVKIKIKNFSGHNNLDSVKIGWSVNGLTQKPFNWQGSLKPGDTSLTINIGAAKFKGGNNILKIWTFKPNGGEDNNYNNDTLTSTIFFLPTPKAKTGENNSICIGDSTTIGSEAVAGNIYHWTSNPPGFNSPQSKLTVAPTITTTYYLKETDTTSGCFAEDSITITVYPIPEPIIEGDTFICGQGTATFEINNSNNSSTYTWEVEGGSITTGQATNKIEIKLNRTTTTGKVKVTEHNPGGCYGISEKEFVYNYTPLVDLGPDQYICEDFGNLLKLDPGHGYITYRWFPTGDTAQWIEVRKVNDYYVVVTDKCGNEMKDEVRIASNCPVTIYIPNAFTPNKDDRQLNEIFRPLIENVVEYSFTIYNRWGERIFISNDYNLGWDGNYFGKLVPEGVYLWMIKCTVKEGAISRKLNKSGTVQLLR